MCTNDAYLLFFSFSFFCGETPICSALDFCRAKCHAQLNQKSIIIFCIIAPCDCLAHACTENPIWSDQTKLIIELARRLPATDMCSLSLAIKRMQSLCCRLLLLYTSTNNRHRSGNSVSLFFFFFLKPRYSLSLRLVAMIEEKKSHSCTVGSTGTSTVTCLEQEDSYAHAESGPGSERPTGQPAMCPNRPAS